MRYLGIDFGTKRVGLAISDEEGRLAFPYLVLKNDQTLFQETERVVKEQKIKEIVIGESKDFSGKDNPIAEKIEEFKKSIEKVTKKKINYEPEFLTSVQAGRKYLRRPYGTRGSGRRAEDRRTNDMLDASAAAIILQSFLDKKNR